MTSYSFSFKNLTSLFTGVAVIGFALASDDLSAQTKKPVAKQQTEASFAGQSTDAEMTAPAAANKMLVQLQAKDNFQTLAIGLSQSSFSEGQAMQMAQTLVLSRTQAELLTQGDLYSMPRYRLTPKIMMHHLNYRQQVNAVYDYIVGNLISQPVEATFADGDQVPAAGNKRLQMLVEGAFPDLRQVRQQIEAARASAVAANKSDIKIKTPAAQAIQNKK